MTLPPSHTWKQRGSLMLWRYANPSRHYAGWHMTGDAAGCASMVALLQAFEDEATPMNRSLALSAPGKAALAVPNSRTAPVVAARKLRLSLAEASPHWSLMAAPESAELRVGREWLPALRQAIAGIPSGHGDHAIGPEHDGRLWFWWWPAPAR